MVAPGETSGKTGTAEGERTQLGPLDETAIIETQAPVQQDQQNQIQGHITGKDTESNPLVVAPRVAIGRRGVKIRMQDSFKPRGGVDKSEILDVYANLSSSSALAA